VGIRPERLLAEPGEGDGRINSTGAVVLTKMYLGGQIQIVVTMPNDAHIVIREQRATADPALDTVHPGDRITVSWDEHAPLLLGTTEHASAIPEEES